jgi:hypothetical protein
MVDGLGSQTALEFYARNGMTPLYVTMVNETGNSPEGLRA